MKCFEKINLKQKQKIGDDNKSMINYPACKELNPWVKVTRIIPEFRILRLNSADYNSFSDLISVYLKVVDHLTWNF